jgi:hypothetical protein
LVLKVYFGFALFEFGILLFSFLWYLDSFLADLGVTTLLEANIGYAKGKLGITVGAVKGHSVYMTEIYGVNLREAYADTPHLAFCKSPYDFPFKRLGLDPGQVKR